VAFAVDEPARHPLIPPKGGCFDDACSGFARAADRTVASAPLRTRPLDHARGHRYQGPGRLPGPDSHRQVALNLSLGYVMTDSFPSRRPSHLGAPVDKQNCHRPLVLVARCASKCGLVRVS
jgi:hypothetical protein